MINRYKYNYKNIDPTRIIKLDKVMNTIDDYSSSLIRFPVTIANNFRAFSAGTEMLRNMRTRIILIKV